MAAPRQCLVWLPHSYTGRGPAESCVRTIEHFAELGLQPTLFVHRARKTISDRIAIEPALTGLLNKMPYRLVAKFAGGRLERMFRNAVERAAPGSIAYFWPDAPTELVRHAKAKGLICVREMINSPWATALPILEGAYRDAGVAAAHGITREMITAEAEQMALFDFVFSSNDEVDAALVGMGVPEGQILKASFGWVKGRFNQTKPIARTRHEGSAKTRFRAAFVGFVGVRKGVHTLLEAWDLAGIDGELVLAGAIEPELASLIDESSKRADIQHLGHVDDVAALYRSCDVFIFPTYEEGGPQVTYEAAACGAPVITTSMGAARLFEDGVSGLVCEAGSSDSLSSAMRALAQNAELRHKLSENASAKVEDFEYANVGKRRAQLLLDAAQSVQ